MARKPNYDFERRERERLKAEKKVKRAAEKNEAQEKKREPSEQPQQNETNNPMPLEAD